MNKKNEEQLIKWLKDNMSFEEMSEEELKERFINSFGIDKWNEYEVLISIDKLVLSLCDFLNIDYVPVIFEEIGIEDSRYYDELNYIAINKKYINNILEIRKSIIHEVKHAHQKYCVSHKENKKLNFAPAFLIEKWSEDFKKNQRLVPLNEINLMSVEIDAFAFTKYILKEWFNYDYHNFDPVYDELLSLYCKKFFN